ncbi:type 2 lanthipeptide synthetase LanM family protein [Streptomyces sp. NPDC006289]|uniref:type 2 lanthipeptide synthetase LanM family protein n=1 Tax=Streptomyces sp. NPDC006289 TaxID=3156744 RepID=UPI0033A9AF86
MVELNAGGGAGRTAEAGAPAADHDRPEHADVPAADHDRPEHAHVRDDASPLLDSPVPGGPWWVPGVVGPHPGTEPGWAAFVREAVAGAPPEALVADRAYPDLTGFEVVVAPFAVRAADRLVDAVPGDGARPGTAVCPPSVLEGFRQDVARRLALLAARTLVSELHGVRQGAGLSGDGPEERFRDFLRLTAGRAGLTSLVTGYPVLARVLAQAAMNAADAFAEMLRRLAADRDLLASSAVLHGTGTAGSAAHGPMALTGVTAGTGDSHRGGRSVMLLRFADGTRLVYKPRPLTAHRHFDTLVEWFNSHAGTPDLRAPGVVDRGAYGWAEFVEEAPCLSAAETTLFYRRLGALLALLHVLDGTDLHHENLIACGPHPVLVDVETLFHPPLTQAPPADPAARALHASVHRVGLLPQLLIGDTTALDMSAVGGGRADRSPLETASWAGAGTDTMHLVRAAGRFTESANRPTLDGERADPFRYTDALCEGFRAAYTAVSDSREDLLGEKGLLRVFARDEIRFVPRPTWTYATLLHESTHPDLMRDATERQQVFGLLRTGALGTPALPGLEDEEIAELWQGDVPVFTTRPDSRYVWSGNGRRMPGPAGATGLARVESKIRALDTVDRQDQERIIRTAMVSTSTEPPHRAAGGGRARAEATAPEPERLLSAARSVGDQLVSLAYHGGGRTNWIGLELLGERYWRLTPMAADLAGGYTGPALFLAQLASLTGAARYADAARAALAPVPGLLDTLHQNGDDLGLLGSGAFSGLGGIAYALAEIGKLLDDRQVSEWAGPATRLSCAASSAEEGMGVRGGAAGGLVSLLAVHRATGRTEAWRGAERCAERIASAALPASEGFAEGAAGVGWALLRFAGAGGGTRYRDAGLDALRRAVLAGHDGPAWCEGGTGIALAVADSPQAVADPELRDWLTARADDLARATPPGDDSLCHGELGVLELLGHGALPLLRPHWLRRTGTLLAAADRAQPHCGTPAHVPHPGLLTGLSGIGHGLLRAGFPDRIGPVLLMRHSVGGEGSPVSMTLSTNEQ